MSPATAAPGSVSTVSDVTTRVDALVSTLRERARDTELQLHGRFLVGLEPNSTLL
jgi:hypothetical protein